MSDRLFGITDAATGLYGAVVTPDGAMLHRLTGADGETAAVVARVPDASEAGIVIKSYELATVIDLLTLMLAELKRLR